MQNLEVIDKLNKHKNKKYLQVDEKPKKDEYYVGYSGNNKEKLYVRLSEKGAKEINGRIFPIFDGFVDGKTSVIFISGARGKGKTIWLSAISDDYHKLNEKNKIYYVCSTKKSEDENLKKMKFVEDFDISELNQFKILDSKIKEDEITEEHKDANVLFKKYNNCLFLFDDIDSLGKEIQKRVNNFFDLLLELGRKKGVSVAKVSHFETNGHVSRLLIRELNYYITFNDDNLQMNRLVNNYKKFDIKRLDPSETYLVINFNMGYVITNKRTFIL